MLFSSLNSFFILISLLFGNPENGTQTMFSRMEYIFKMGANANEISPSKNKQQDVD